MNNNKKMEYKYCKVTNGLTSFKLRYITHKYDSVKGELNLTLRVMTINESKELMNYIKCFSESIAGMSAYKRHLISDIVISGDDRNSSFSFKDCLLISISFDNDIFTDSDIIGCNVKLSFKGGRKLKKLYLSGPMSLCKDEATWRANFQKYEDIFTEKGYIVVNPAKNEILPTYEECLKHSLQQEMECDCIFFMENAILSTGARLEYEIAKACGIEIIVLDDDISLTDNYENNSGIKCKNK